VCAVFHVYVVAKNRYLRIILIIYIINTLIFIVRLKLVIKKVLNNFIPVQINKGTLPPLKKIYVLSFIQMIHLIS